MFNANKNIYKYQKQAFNYAKELNTAFSKYTAQVKRKITCSKMSNVKQAKAR